MIAAGAALELPPSSNAAEEHVINNALSNEIDITAGEAEDDAGGIDDEGYRRDLLEIGETASQQERPASVSYHIYTIASI